jgi:hypothetical protein
MKVTLECRIVGISQVTLSPFSIHKCDSKTKIGAFLSIEVLTFTNEHIKNDDEKHAYDKEW